MDRVNAIVKLGGLPGTTAFPFARELLRNFNPVLIVPYFRVSFQILLVLTWIS